jgi:hypothetical protein
MTVDELRALCVLRDQDLVQNSAKKDVVAVEEEEEEEESDEDESPAKDDTKSIFRDMRALVFLKGVSGVYDQGTAQLITCGGQSLQNSHPQLFARLDALGEARRAEVQHLQLLVANANGPIQFSKETGGFLLPLASEFAAAEYVRTAPIKRYPVGMVWLVLTMESRFLHVQTAESLLKYCLELSSSGSPSATALRLRGQPTYDDYRGPAEMFARNVSLSLPLAPSQDVVRTSAGSQLQEAAYLKRLAASWRAANRSSCVNCGEAGHSGRDCLKPCMFCKTSSRFRSVKEHSAKACTNRK